jgi:hypothetical protein
MRVFLGYVCILYCCVGQFLTCFWHYSPIILLLVFSFMYMTSYLLVYDAVIETFCE